MVFTSLPTVLASYNDFVACYKGFSYFLQWFHHTTILKYENNDFGVVYNDFDFYNGYLYFDTTISNIF